MLVYRVCHNRPRPLDCVEFDVRQVSYKKSTPHERGLPNLPSLHYHTLIMPRVMRTRRGGLTKGYGTIVPIGMCLTVF